MSKLFVFYVGGKTETSLTELHDVRFAVGDTVESCHDSLRRQWWGVPQSLHIDCYGVLDYADGYDIALKAEPAQGDKKLYFVNLGGYNPVEFTELHRNTFVVATDEVEAKAKAKKQIANWHSPHRDYMADVDAILSVDDLVKDTGLRVHLSATETARPFTFTCGYFPIGLN